VVEQQQQQQQDPIAPAEPQDVLDEEWRFSGHPWVGRGVRRLLVPPPIANRYRDFSGLAPAPQLADGVVEKWVPQGKEADDWALWRVVYRDGSVEDLEEHEAAEATAMWTARYGAGAKAPPLPARQPVPPAAEPASEPVAEAETLPETAAGGTPV